MASRKSPRLGESEQSGSLSKNLGLPGALLAGAMATFAGKAEAAWDCGYDLDSMVPGTSYNGEPVYGFSGIPGGPSTRTVTDGPDGTAEFTHDGVSFSNVRGDVSVIDPSLGSTTLELTGYSSNFDQTVLRSLSNSYLVSNFSGGSSEWSLSDIDRGLSGGGSVDDTTGNMAITVYNSGTRIDIDEYPSGDPLVRSSSNESYSQWDSANDRMGICDDDFNFVLVENVSGAQARTTLVEYAIPVQYLSAKNSPNGMDTWIYNDGSDWTLKYCEDPDSAIPADPDSDADGSPASEDCDDEDPDVHPGAEEVDDDDVDNDCEADAPVITDILINKEPAMVTPMPMRASMGDAVGLDAIAGDDEDRNENLEYIWEITDDYSGDVVAELDGPSTTFYPPKSGSYSIRLTVTDTTTRSTEASSSVMVALEVEEVLGSELEGGEIVESPVSEEGYIAVTGGYPYVDEDGTIELEGYGDSVYVEGAWNIYGVEADTTLYTDSSLRGEAGMGVMGAMATDYGPYVDTTDTTKMLVVDLEAGGFDAVGGKGGFDVTITTPGDYHFADIESEADADADTDADSDSDADADGDTDADGDGDSDPDTANPDSGDTGDNGRHDVNNPGDCGGCATSVEGHSTGWYSLALVSLLGVLRCRKGGNSQLARI